MPEVSAGQTYLDILRAFTVAGATDRIRDHVLACAILELADRKPPLPPSSEFMTAMSKLDSAGEWLDNAISCFDPNSGEQPDHEDLALALAAMRQARADVAHLVRRTLPPGRVWVSRSKRGSKPPKKKSPRRGPDRAR